MRHSYFSRFPFAILVFGLLGSWTCVMEAQDVAEKGARDWRNEQGLTSSSLLLNGGFEEEPGLPVWELSSNTPPQRSDQEAHSGRFSVHSKLVNEGPQPSEGHVRQTVREGVVGGEPYTLEFWVRELDFGISYVQQYALVWLDAGGEEMEEGKIGLTNFRAGRKDWQSVRVEGLVAPDGAQGVEFFLRFVTGAVARGSGEVFVDDIVLEPENMELRLALPEASPEPTLVWQNGDAIQGRLIASEGNRVAWRSSLFLDPVSLDSAALDSIRFAAGEATPVGDFRLETVMGDVLTVAIEGASPAAYQFSSPRYGRFTVDQNAVYGIRRLDSPNRLFQATHLSDWRPALDGPLAQVHYQTHRIAPGEVAETSYRFDATTLLNEGEMASGFFDAKVGDVSESVVVRFTARLAIPESGDYEFDFARSGNARFWVEETEILSTAKKRRTSGPVSLEKGVVSVRYESVAVPGKEGIGLRWKGPGFSKTPLDGTNRRWAWRESADEHPYTRLNTTGLYRSLTLPDSFHLDLEVASRSVPQFAMSLGPDANRADLEAALRLETWGDELVLTNDTVFEPVLVLDSKRREIRIRLSYDRKEQTFRVFELGGRHLKTVDNIKFETGKSGIFWRNRGSDLTVRRVSVYRMTENQFETTVDATRPRVHMVDGSVHYGVLVASEGRFEVVESETSRVGVNLDSVERLVQPGRDFMPERGGVELIYPDGDTLRGNLVSLDADVVRLQSLFAVEPLSCQLSGALRLQFDGSGSYRSPTSYGDRLVVPSSRLRGGLSFGLDDAPFGWSLVGAERPVRLSESAPLRVMRDRAPLSVYYSFDPYAFPSVMYLINGESFPCRLRYLDASEVRFESPILEAVSLDAAFVKAIELDPMGLLPGGQSRQDTRDRGGSRVPIRQISQRSPVEETTLSRALAVPRFKREEPASHVIVATNGDLKRGQLIAVEETVIRFQSRLREGRIPRERLAVIVDIRKKGDLERFVGRVRLELVDGSVLFLNPHDFDDRHLIGESPIYGRVTVPVNQILTLDTGDVDSQRFKSKFSAWESYPAPEPTFR